MSPYSCSILWFLVCQGTLYLSPVCVANLHQVNSTRTLCYSDVAEFVCSQHQVILSWRVSSATSTTPLLSFTTQSSVQIREASLEFTPVIARVIFSNSTFIKSSLTVSASLSVTIECNLQAITYQLLNSKCTYQVSLFL